MNPLFAGRQASARQAQQPNLSELSRMLNTMTPEQAKAQVERICAERGITAEQLDQTIRQAQEIGRGLGIR